MILFFYFSVGSELRWGKGIVFTELLKHYQGNIYLFHTIKQGYDTFISMHKPSKINICKTKLYYQSFYKKVISSIYKIKEKRKKGRREGKMEEISKNEK